MTRTTQISHAQRLLARAQGAAAAIDNLWQAMPATADGEIFRLLREARTAAFLDLIRYRLEVKRLQSKRRSTAKTVA